MEEAGCRARADGREPIDILETRRMRDTTQDVRRWLEKHPAGLVVLLAAWPLSLIAEPNDAATFVRDMKTLARETESAIAIPWWLRASSTRGSYLTGGFRPL